MIEVHEETLGGEHGLELTLIVHAEVDDDGARALRTILEYPRDPNAILDARLEPLRDGFVRQEIALEVPEALLERIAAEAKERAGHMRAASLRDAG